MVYDLPQTPSAFYNYLLSRAINALKMNTFVDNFDSARFNLNGIDHSRSWKPLERAFYFDWMFKNQEHLFAAYSALDNEESQNLYIQLIMYRMAGHFCVRLPVAFADKKEELEQYIAAEKFTPSKIELSGMFGGLKHFDFEHKGKKYVADCMGFEPYLFRGQYFYSVNGVNVCPEPGDYVIDGGACLGDTALVFSNAVEENGRVYSFDPVDEHVQVSKFNTTQFPYNNVEIMPYGLSDKSQDGELIVLGTYAPGFRSGTHPIPLRAVDQLVEEGVIPKIDFIKLDVEGAEIEALSGAQDSIRKFKPKLAISLYHKTDDIFEIILAIKEVFPFYKMYIDHYTIHAEETVLYCIA